MILCLSVPARNSGKENLLTPERLRQIYPVLNGRGKKLP